MHFTEKVRCFSLPFYKEANMKNPFKLLFRARDEPKPTDAVSAAPVFYFGSSASGKPVNARTAIQMSTVYARFCSGNASAMHT